MVSLLPDDGYGIIGTPAETEGETRFPGVWPGKYVVEASAPGYLTVRQSMQIEAGHRERILYVVMKPIPAAQGAEETSGGYNALGGREPVCRGGKASR